MSKKLTQIVRFHKTGGPEVLKIETMPTPEPGKGEVRVAARFHKYLGPQSEPKFGPN